MVIWSGGTYERLGKFSSWIIVLRHVSGLRASKIVAPKRTGASAKTAQNARIGVYNMKTCQYDHAFTKSVLRSA